MFKIINKQILARNVLRMDIDAPDIALRIRPGQFVSVCPEESDDHIPLTVTSSDSQRGCITLIFSESGAATRKLGAMSINEPIFSVLGPLGRPAVIEKKGVVVCIATGFGIPQILPICRAFKEQKNRVIGMIGAKSRKDLILEPQMRLSCDKLFIATEDGSYDRRGQATDILEKFLSQNTVDCVYAIGSVQMMRAVAELTAVKKIKTLVRVNPVMTDCMGMCGSCRVRVGGKTVLACVDGPEFDGNKVDYDDLEIRMKAYKEPEGWGKRLLKRKPAGNGSRILTKFLSGIRKS